ncbi:reverse transcriptase domain-containing protein [Bradyrhizobium cytisi]|uniref:reverse transcriptase domain-containing protein n=1 Tax=Bradyrhizobium cytisi TaxID=515489 RepID=UPI001652DED2|nr:reverse transcriptase domain-containing protein [Bradyrhizobium cytisi]
MPKALGSANDFYAYLGVGAGERKFLEKHAFHRYKRVIVPKRRGGTRVLMVPDRRLKFLQRKAHQLLNQLYRPRTPVHGFVKQKGAISNANEHQRRPYLFNIDLRNFFGVISRRRVLGMLISMGLPDDAAEAVCSVCLTANQLPQGAPTSPILSNLVAYRLDRDLMKFAKTYRLKYTRYADDISFSSYAPPLALFNAGLPIPGRVKSDQLSVELSTVLATNGFEIAPDKVWFAGPKSRKEVTGLVVNEFTNLKRSFVRNVRAALYKTEKLGLAAAQSAYQKKYTTNATLEQVLRGRLEWIAQVRGRSFDPYRTLAKRFNNLFPNSPLPILPTHEETAERAVWVVEFFADEDNCAQGTAFFLAGVGLVTAHHVLEKLPPGAHADLYRPSGGGNKFKATPSKRSCPIRDLMILEHDVPTTDYLSLPVVTSPEQRDDKIVALGFPDYGPGDQLSRRGGQIYGRATKHGVKLLEVSAILSDGISGGPVVNDQHQVIGIAKKGGIEERKQLAVEVSELLKLADE